MNPHDQKTIKQILSKPEYMGNADVIDDLKNFIELINPMDPNDSDFQFSIALVLICITCAGIAAGLTIGLSSINKLDLKILKKTGSASEKAYATKIAQLTNDHHYMLVSLLVFNSIANECLPVFLGRLVSEFQSVIISVTAVLFFGEIFPSAIFSGSYKLCIAQYLSPLIEFLFIIFQPITKPICILLDKLVGHDTDFSPNRREMMAQVDILHEDQIENVQLSKSFENRTSVKDSMKNESMKSQRDDLTMDEFQIMKGVMECGVKQASDVMIEIEKIFCVDSRQLINQDLRINMYSKGYSRIPIWFEYLKKYKYMHLKDLAIIGNGIVIDQLPQPLLKEPLQVEEEFNVLKLLNKFQEGFSHIAMVYGQSEEEVLGIVTLEDVIEEILREEILDEKDHETHKKHFSLENLKQLSDMHRKNPTEKNKRVSVPKLGKLSAHSMKLPNMPRYKQTLNQDCFNDELNSFTKQLITNSNNDSQSGIEMNDTLLEKDNYKDQ